MKKIALLILGILTAACVGTSQNSKFYTLKSFSASADVETYAVKAKIGVQEVSLPDYLDRPQMVTSSHNSMEFHFSEFHRWNDSLSLIFQRVLAEDLSVYLPKSEVGIQENGREGFDYLVAVDVIQFDGSFNNEVVLDTWWTLKNASGKILLKRRDVFTKKVGGSYLDLAGAESALLGDFARAVAEGLNRQIR